MSAEGLATPEDQFMVMLTRQEIEELLMALSARARMTGIKSIHSKVCMNILRKLDESKPIDKSEPIASKVAGIDSRKFSDY